MKECWEMELELHTFLTMALNEGEWSASCSYYFMPWERGPGTHRLGSWAGRRARLYVVAKRKNPIIAPARN